MHKTRIWRPFSKDAYRFAWFDKNIVGVISEFVRDIRRCHQRIWNGYCDYDQFSIYDWFLGIMPAMLRSFRDNIHGYPLMPDAISHKLSYGEIDEENDPNLKAWISVLDRMIFLLEEADEETCSRKNPYEEEHRKAQKEFHEKYGMFGEKLLTEEEKTDSENGLGTRWYFLSDVDEYKSGDEKFMEEESKIKAYQRECKDEALALFSKWFYDLWD